MRKIKEEKGASAVEFAIVASLLLLILFGIIQFGIAYNRVQGLNSAAREGARVASVDATQADVVSRVTSAQAMFVSNDVRVTIETSGDNGTTWTTRCTDPDSGARACTSTATSNAPCNEAGAGDLIRVTTRVPPPPANLNRYAIAIPLWANWRLTYRGAGTFRCEKQA